MKLTQKTINLIKMQPMTPQNLFHFSFFGQPVVTVLSRYELQSPSGESLMTILLKGVKEYIFLE